MLLYHSFGITTGAVGEFTACGDKAKNLFVNSGLSQSVCTFQYAVIVNHPDRKYNIRNEALHNNTIRRINVDTKIVGNQIAVLRKGKGLTQSELGERLGVSFQAVSKWERGETLPDTAILLDLAEVLETSVDYILSGGCQVLHYSGKITVQEMKDGIIALKRMGELLGRDNMIYRCAVEGIHEKMNTNIEDAFGDDRVFEGFVAEAIMQGLASGKYIDLTDVKNGFQHDHFREIVLKCCAKRGIK